jgi:hypothetical protein
MTTVRLEILPSLSLRPIMEDNKFSERNCQHRFYFLRLSSMSVKKGDSPLFIF